MERMYCQVCGERTERGAKFCGECGAPQEPDGSGASGRGRAGETVEAAPVWHQTSRPLAEHATARPASAAEVVARMPVLDRILGAAAAVIAISAFLPWVSVDGITASGTAVGDGVYTLLLAVAGLAALAVMSGIVRVSDDIDHRAVMIGEAIAAGVATVISLTNLHDYAGLGLYLTLGAALVWVVVALRRIYEASAR